jgi:spore germination protein YaaH
VKALANLRTLLAFASVLALAAVGPAGAVVSRSTAQPLQAFVLTSSPDSFVDLRAHVGAIGVIYPTYFECSVPGGAVQGAPNPAVDVYAHAQRLAELPRFNCQDGATVHRILTDPRLRARTLTRLVALASSHLYRGLNLDLENDGARDREALSSFVVVLAARLHALGKRLSVDIVGVTHEDSRIGTGFYDDRALVAAADTVFVMAWGAHWEGSVPGPIAPLSYVAGVAGYVASLPHARRFVLGIPMYGLDWTAAGGPERPAHALQDAGVLALARSVGAAPARDPASGEMTFAYTRAGAPHRVWYMDARAILDRVRIARAHGLAAGVWRLGQEDQTVWTSPPL